MIPSNLNLFSELVVRAPDPLDEQLALEVRKVSVAVQEVTDYWEDGFQALEEATARLRAQLALQKDENDALKQAHELELQGLEDQFQTDATTLASEEQNVVELEAECTALKDSLSEISSSATEARAHLVAHWNQERHVLDAVIGPGACHQYLQTYLSNYRWQGVPFVGPLVTLENAIEKSKNVLKEILK